MDKDKIVNILKEADKLSVKEQQNRELPHFINISGNKISINSSLAIIALIAFIVFLTTLLVFFSK